MKNKVVELDQAVAAIKDGQTILFGDWHGEISAEEIITGIIEKGVKDITAVGVSGGMPDQGLGRMIVAHQVKKLLTTHIGLNPVAKDQYVAGELESSESSHTSVARSPAPRLRAKARIHSISSSGDLRPFGMIL